MQYSDYMKQAAHLDKAIAECRAAEARAAAGKGLLIRMIPGLRETRVAAAARRRAALARAKHRLAKEFFGDEANLLNANVGAAVGRTVSHAPDAVERLRDAAEAALGGGR